MSWTLFEQFTSIRKKVIILVAGPVVTYRYLATGVKHLQVTAYNQLSSVNYDTPVYIQEALQSELSVTFSCSFNVS
jgi:hypothetical protein